LLGCVARQIQRRRFGRNHPDNRRGDINHDPKMQPIVIPPTRRRTRADELSIEFLSLQSIGKRTQTARQIDAERIGNCVGKKQGSVVHRHLALLGMYIVGGHDPSLRCRAFLSTVYAVGP